MPTDKQVQMRYPSPETGRKVRGPVQEIIQEDGRIVRRRLHIRTNSVMVHELARDFKSRGVAKVVEGVTAE
jgi:hypothetical protein